MRLAIFALCLASPAFAQDFVVEEGPPPPETVLTRIIADVDALVPSADAAARARLASIRQQLVALRDGSSAKRTSRVLGRMLPGELEALLLQLNRYTLTADRLAFLRTAAESHAFDATQVSRIVQRVKLSQDKLEVATLLGRHMVDRERWPEVCRSLTWPSDCERFRKSLDVAPLLRRNGG